MTEQSGFQLATGDIEILRFLYDYRFLHIGHLIALTGRRHQMIHRRLLKLVDRRFIARITPPAHKHIYTLGRAAGSVLVEHGIAPLELIDARLRHHELKELFLKHTLMIVDLHVGLARATCDSHARLVLWKQGQDLYDRVTFKEAGRNVRLPVRPDAFFTLEDVTRDPGKNRLHFMLEADRSTTTHERFLKKIKAYWQYFIQELHTKKYSIKSFRVVTVALTKERALNLREAAEHILPQAARKYYLFAAIHEFLNSPLGDIWSTPHDAQRCSFMPSAVAPAERFIL